MNVSPARQQFLGRSLGDWLSTFPIFCLLILTLVVGTGEMVHGQLLKLGESLFGDPANGVQYWMLRVDPVAPTCNPNVDVDAQVHRHRVLHGRGDRRMAMAVFDQGSQSL